MAMMRLRCGSYRATKKYLAAARQDRPWLASVPAWRSPLYDWNPPGSRIALLRRKIHKATHAVLGGLARNGRVGGAT